ncbi:MAG: hypothetical protein ACRCU0_01770 [Candidatus Rhabdochlamydia sp.]
MQKKYIQVLLSINFCLTAMTAIANSDSDSSRSFDVISEPDTDSTGSFEIMNDEESLNEYIEQFTQIWNCLDKINNSHPSKLLENLIEQHKESIANPFLHDERLEEVSKDDLENQVTQINSSLAQILSNYETEEGLDQTVLSTQVDKIEDCLDAIHSRFRINMPNEEKAFLKQQLEQLEIFSQNFISPLVATLSNQFYHIWNRLGKINAIHSSKLLEGLLLQHKEDMKKIIPYKEMLEEMNKEEPELLNSLALQYNTNSLSKEMLEEHLKKKLDDQLKQLNESLKLCSNQIEEALDENGKENLHVQVAQIENCAEKIHELYHSKTEPLLKEETIFLKYQLAELQRFSERLIEDKKNQANPESSLVEWKGQFNQIWNCLNELNASHSSELLQRLILQHEKDMQNPVPYTENQEEINKEELDNQFAQLFSTLKSYSKSQVAKDELITQYNQIEEYLDAIHNTYSFKKELLKEEKAFLRYQLAELQHFSERLIEDKKNQANPESSLIDFGQKIPEIELRKMQELLESYQEEDSAIYAQYEPLINNEEIHSLDFLIDSETEKSFLYFNESEGLIEIQHKDENEETYTTTWKIGEADRSYMKNWKENNPITIQKTGLLSKYSMSKYLLGESLEYTLNNKGKTSVRANFVCKSSQENTYPILSIDYHEKVVILKNGPCLFIQGNLNNWHVEDNVTLHIIGSTLDPKRPHKLINKTRPSNDPVACLLRKK